MAATRGQPTVGSSHSDTPVVSPPRILLETLLAEPPGERTEYDVADDGRFLIAGVRGIDMALFSRVHVVINWFAELEQQVPGAP